MEFVLKLLMYWLGRTRLYNCILRMDYVFRALFLEGEERSSRHWAWPYAFPQQTYFWYIMILPFYAMAKERLDKLRRYTI